MINLGPYKATGLPEVKIYPTVIDRIFTFLSVLAMVVIWVLVTVYYVRYPETTTHEVLVWGGASTLITVLLLVSMRMPVRMFNFPVRVNEYNLARQFFLARRVTLIAMLELNIMMLCRMLDSFNPVWLSGYRLFDILSFIILGLLGVTFIIYFIVAMTWR